MISDILKERMILEMFVGTQLAPKILNALLLESVVNPDVKLSDAIVNVPYRMLSNVEEQMWYDYRTGAVNK